ncbi:MAG: RNA polymerase sigma factor [Chloroflexi bacterium AL-W]|nr:RNA polymerase sigma factor [Chloroflexi bacterium AL-N1]NOK70071.1 RNA polymerase sigma factor [Chloroflexi bacterium AL-N10]NOK77917.1 RNA polymerase sigma factor [Chloroflexi bacterium AL-N5]NOK84926.1 RNA polymerase sigma factor [Chloroflexi bacterium AL-W]NOK91905.1 RNA polymerase sigma factor [Chloroflexi bacterium AL-N15]
MKKWRTSTTLETLSCANDSGGTPTTTADTDEQLYAQVLAGDTTALVPLVSRYHASLLAFAYRQTGDRLLAEDLVQDAFTRMVIYHGAPPQRFRGWAFTIVRNLVYDHYRSAYAQREQQGIIDLAAMQPHIEPGSDKHIRQGAVQSDVTEALQHLTPEQREVLILRFYHDLRLSEDRGDYWRTAWHRQKPYVSCVTPDETLL